MLKIRELQKSEIELIEKFPPEEWNLNIIEFFRIHYGKEYLYPVVAEINGVIAGCAVGFNNVNAAWLGNIIVKDEFRRQGIGHDLTTHLVNYFTEKKITAQILTASEMGKNIYSRIGFKFTSDYLVFKGGNVFTDYTRDTCIRKICSSDYPDVIKMDRYATDENREALIREFLSTGWVYKDNQAETIRGFYLPEIGAGLIVATDDDAGIELMKFRLGDGKPTAIVPSGNRAAIDFLLAEGYQHDKSLPRMVLGDEVNWKQHFVFNRAAGYCG